MDPRRAAAQDANFTQQTPTYAQVINGMAALHSSAEWHAALVCTLSCQRSCQVFTPTKTKSFGA